MKKSMTAIALGTVLTLGACSGGAMTDTERATVGGGALGAASGALIGSATGNDPATGALLGGAAGALGGYLYEQNVDN